MWKLGEDRSEIVRLAIENASITNAYRKDLTVAGVLGGYRDLGKQRGAICALVNGYSTEGVCPYYLPELLEFVKDEGLEPADALYKAAKPLAIHGMPETPWRKRLLKAIQDLGEEREVIIQLAVNNNLITKDIYQFDTDVIKILNAIKDIGATREEVCDSVKVFIRPEMDVYNVVKFIEMIGGIKTDRDSICTLTNRIIQTRGLHQIMPLMIQKSQWSRNYPYLDYCRELICDVESLGDSREDIVMTAIPLFTQDLDPIEIRGFLQKTKNLGDDRSIISKLVKTNGLLTSSNNNYKNEGLFQTLEAVKNIKKDREVLCSVAKDFVWEQMRAGELGGYFDILNEVGEDCAAINALAISHNLLPLRPKDDARRTTFSFNSGRECDYLFLVRKALFAVKTLGGKRDLILSLLKDYLTEEAWVPLFRDFSTSRDQENARFLESLGELGPIPDCETRIRVAQDCRLIKPKMKWKEVAGVLKYLGTLPLASLQDHCSKATEQITDEMVLADEIIDRVQTVNPIILHAPGARFVVKEVKPEFNIERALDRLGEIKDVVCEEVKDIVFKDTDDLKLYIKEMRSVHELGRHPRSVCAEAKRFIPYCKNANGFGDFLDQTRNTLLYFPEVYELSHDLIQKYSKGKKTTLDSVAKLIHVIKRLGHNRDRVCNIAKSLTYNWGVEDLNNLLEMIEEVCANTGDQCEAIFSWADQIITPDTDKQGFIYTINDVFGVIDDPHRLNVMYLTQKFRVLQEKYPICFLLCYEDKRAEEVVNRLKGLENCEEVLLQAEDKMTDGMTIDDLLNLLVKG